MCGVHSDEISGAEVLTMGYLDENGELICEDAVDSDDDFAYEEGEDDDAKVSAQQRVAD